jgi:hypothetical protein
MRKPLFATLNSGACVLFRPYLSSTCIFFGLWLTPKFLYARIWVRPAIYIRRSLVLFGLLSAYVFLVIFLHCCLDLVCQRVDLVDDFWGFLMDCVFLICFDFLVSRVGRRLSASDGFDLFNLLSLSDRGFVSIFQLGIDCRSGLWT